MVNTLFPHKISRRTTWHLPDGVTHNQIDYFSRHGDSSIASTEPGAKHSQEQEKQSPRRAQDDDEPETEAKFTESRLKTVQRFNLEKLKDMEVADQFEATIGGKFAAFNLLE